MMTVSGQPLMDLITAIIVADRILGAYWGGQHKTGLEKKLQCYLTPGSNVIQRGVCITLS